TRLWVRAEAKDFWKSSRPRLGAGKQQLVALRRLEFDAGSRRGGAGQEERQHQSTRNRRSAVEVPVGTLRATCRQSAAGAAVMPISITSCGVASRASTVARAGGL